MNVKQAVARRIELLCKERSFVRKGALHTMNWLIYVVLLHLPFILFLMIKEKILRYQLLRKYVMVLKSA